jgi:hypothetical protein
VVEALGALLIGVREATQDCCPGAFDHLMTEMDADGARGARR